MFLLYSQAAQCPVLTFVPNGTLAMAEICGLEQEEALEAMCTVPEKNYFKETSCIWVYKRRHRSA